MTSNPDSTPAVTETVETRLRVRIRDLGLAPENLRSREPADDGIPRLADTVRAAGLIYPPIVRPGRGRREQKYMVLDGRRRRFALLLEVERGARTLDDEIECILAADKAAQAAAVVLTATEHAPVHLADVLIAIGKLRKARLETAAIAGALGYGVLEIKRLEALSAVHGKVLEAFRRGKLTLRQVRMFARLGDRKRQGELAETALAGDFQDYQLQQLVKGARVTVDTDALRLVGLARYGEAGGRISADLFGELPDVLLDPEILQRLWRDRAQAFVAGLEALDVAVHIADDRGFGAPDDLMRLPYVHDGMLPEDRRGAYRDARSQVAEARAALEEVDLAAPSADARMAALLAARLATARAGLVHGAVEAVLLSPCATDGVEITAFWRWIEADQAAQDVAAADGDEGATVRGATQPDIAPVAVEVDVTGLGHRVHELRTDIATRGLIRDLADHPEAALTAIVAQLFKELALYDQVHAGASALAVKATAYRWSQTPVVPALDGVARDRLARRRDDYLASGLRPIAYVDALPHADKLALLAELVAVSLDLREARTTSLRREARAEAAEIAGLCGADLGRHWTPDTAFLDAHSKPQLLAMLDDMTVKDDRVASLKKAALVETVVGAAAERRWTPVALQWTMPAAEVEAEAEAPDADTGAVARDAGVPAQAA
jgi:ParB family chromosome partitioning protein